MSGPTENPPRENSRSGPPAAVPGRYGASRPSSRPIVIVLAVLLVGVLTGWAVWAASTDRPAIDATLTSYDVVSSHEIRVQVTARFRDAHPHGSCLVRATAEDHTVVGEINLTADQLRSSRGHWIPVRTERRATTAELVRCTH